MKSSVIIEKIKARVAAVDPNGPRKVLAVIQINVTTDDGIKYWIVDLKNLKVSEGQTDSADITLDIDDDTMLQVGSRKLSFEDAQSAGKANVTGDLGLVTALHDVLK